MAVNYLPKEITKDMLYKRALERFQDWTKFYGDPNISAQHLYEDMSCSCYCGNPADDFPEIVVPKKEDVIRYQYEDGTCYFFVDGIEVEVYDLRSMRESSRFGKALFSDICGIGISYKDDDAFMQHIIPNTWLYGSTSEEFSEGAEVDKSFVDAAREYIKQHEITKEMQNVD